MSNLSKDTMMLVYPQVLTNDKTYSPIGETVADNLDTAYQNVKSVSIYPSIDDLPEGVLDILAKDFKIDWYDYDETLEVKRNTVKSNFKVHRLIGTLGGMKQGLKNVWDNVEVEEWFNYSGDPYHFRVAVTDTYSAEKEAEALFIIGIAKNVRSVLDSITFNGGEADVDLYIGMAVYGTALRDAVIMY